MARVETFGPILRWAGSKKQLLDELSSYWRRHHRTYIEPFCGSAALFARINPRRAILGDSNKDLIEMYRTVREYPEFVYDAVSQWKSNKATYYAVRSKDPTLLDDITRAARFLYLNRHCFNGLYRTNRKGEFNVPWGATGAGAMPDLESFVRFARSLRGKTLLACDFAETLSRARRGSFVYMDPPYSVSRRRVFREYGSVGFSHNDLSRLREALVSLNRRGVDFVVSYAASPEAETLAKSFSVQRVAVRRSIAGDCSFRCDAEEFLITNVGRGRS